MQIKTLNITIEQSLLDVLYAFLEMFVYKCIFETAIDKEALDLNTGTVNLHLEDISKCMQCFFRGAVYTRRLSAFTLSAF